MTLRERPAGQRGAVDLRRFTAPEQQGLDPERINEYVRRYDRRQHYVVKPPFHRKPFKSPIEFTPPIVAERAAPAHAQPSAQVPEWFWLQGLTVAVIGFEISLHMLRHWWLVA
jgi:hypothetical protein